MSDDFSSYARDPNRAVTRAAAVWRRLTGLFGGDAVTRKFGAVPPAEWLQAIERLKDFELERAVRRLAYSGRDAVPSLPAFMKLARSLNDDADDALPRTPAPALPEPVVDKWDIAASRHLMARLMRHAAAGLHFTTQRMRTTYPVPAPDQESQALIQPLVAGRNEWSRHMRELELEDALPPDHGRGIWEAIMADAERAAADVRITIAREGGRT